MVSLGEAEEKAAKRVAGKLVYFAIEEAYAELYPEQVAKVVVNFNVFRSKNYSFYENSRGKQLKAFRGKA